MHREENRSEHRILGHIQIEQEIRSERMSQWTGVVRQIEELGAL